MKMPVKGHSLFLFLTVFAFGIISNSAAQEPIQLDNWMTYSSILNSIACDADSKDRIWIGTNGGAYCYNPIDKSYREFRNIDAMLSMDVSALAANPSTKEIFIGTFDGVVEVVTEDFQWTHLTDIKKPNFPNPKINDIKFLGNLAYVAGGFGLTVLDIDSKVFLQTPSRLGLFQPLTNVNEIAINSGKLWAATDVGVASIDISKSLINPDNWDNYTQIHGLPGGKIKGIAAVNGEIYCHNDTSVYKHVDTGFVKILRTDVWDVIGKIVDYKGTLVYSTPFWVRDLKDNFLMSHADTRDTAFINKVIVMKNGDIIALINDAGFVRIEDSKEHIKPKSPVSNLFSDLSVSPDGSLWSATDQTAGKGFMKLKNGVWENFTLKSHPEIKTNSYFKVNCLPDGRTILSSWGFGYLTITSESDNYKLERTDNTNSCLTGVNNSPNWVVTGQSAYDRRNGSLWVINYAQNFPGNMLVSHSNKDEFFCAPENSNREYIIMLCDNSGTKWLGSNNNLGMYYYNEGQKANDPSDDIQGTITTSNSQLQTSNINCLTVDKSGIVWIGTPEGLSYMLSPSSVLRNANPILRQSPLKVLAALPINDIMVDALNNKWIATNQGVYVLDPDGATELKQFNTKNSGLISDEVLSLASDETTGKIYFGTRKGLSVAQSFSIKPLETFSIKCYPQPFHPTRDAHLTIDGLAADADLRIVMPDGTLVKTLQTNSQKITWDGKDELGNFVRTGVYLIFGYSQSTASEAVGKIAVIGD
jgi:streptogramin lyase